MNIELIKKKVNRKIIINTILDQEKKIKRYPELKSNWGTICTPVEMIAVDGKRRKIFGY
jgi:hypothetical protein